MRIAVVAGRFNDHITKPLLDGALGDARATPASTTVPVHWVPGAFEIPLVAQRLAARGACDAVICLGAVIRGDTPHFDFVAGECAAGIARGRARHRRAGRLRRAHHRRPRPGPGPERRPACNGIAGNKGEESAVTAIEMVDLLRQLPHARRHPEKAAS